MVDFGIRFIAAVDKGDQVVWGGDLGKGWSISLFYDDPNVDHVALDTTYLTAGVRTVSAKVGDDERSLDVDIRPAPPPPPPSPPPIDHLGLPQDVPDRVLISRHESGPTSKFVQASTRQAAVVPEPAGGAGPRRVRRFPRTGSPPRPPRRSPA
jgi:hypothetical protein